MITPFVMRVFDRLASSDAILDIARRATPSPSPALVGSFMEEAFKLDGNMRAAFEDARRDDATKSADDPSKEDMFRGDFERILEGIANGGTASARAVSSGDITHLMNMIRFMRRKREGGNDRETKAVGMRETLQGFREGLSKSETRESTAREVTEFVEKAFAGEMDWLMNAYLYSRRGDLKINLLTQDAGGNREKGKERARLTILGLLLEGTRNSIEKELYADKPTDGAALGAIVAGVHHRIDHRKTGDAYDGETAATGTRGGQQARTKWGKYIAPLQDTGKFGHGETLDILGITEFLNDNFLRPDLESRTPVEVPLPGGGTMTAPSFKTKLPNTKVHQWATGASAGVSMDTPIGEGDEGGTLGETIGAPDTPLSKMEEYAIEHLDSPADPHAMEKLRSDMAQTDEGDRILEGVRTNKDLLRAKLRGWIDEAALLGGVREIKDGLPGTRQEVSKDNKDAIRDIVLVKFGFMSEGDDRDDFKRRWLDEREHTPKYYASPMSNDDWDAIGKPLRKVRGTSDAPRKFYEKDWKQNALLNKETGQPPDSTPEVLKNPDAFELVAVSHKKGEAADPRHLVEWHKYNRKQREADLDRGLDTYGPKWFEQSISNAVLDELKESHGDLADVLEKFSPEKIFVSVAKTTDQEMARAMGFIRPTVAPQTNTLHPNYPALQAGIKAVVRNLVAIMDERKGEDEISVLQYMGLKRLGRIASVAT